MCTLLVSRSEARLCVGHTTLILTGANAAAKLRRLLDDCGYGYDGPVDAGVAGFLAHAYRKSAYVGRRPWGA